MEGGRERERERERGGGGERERERERERGEGWRGGRPIASTATDSTCTVTGISADPFRIT